MVMLYRIWLRTGINDIHLELNVQNLALVVQLGLCSINSIPSPIFSCDIKAYPWRKSCTVGKRASEHYFVVTVGKESEPTLNLLELYSSSNIVSQLFNRVGKEHPAWLAFSYPELDGDNRILVLRVNGEAHLQIDKVIIHLIIDLSHS